MNRPSLLQRLWLALQYLAPHHLLTAIVYGVTRWRFGPWKRGFIAIFRRIYAPNLEESESTNIDDYPHINAFFTRALRPDARPIGGEANAIVSPVDAAVSQVGRLRQGQLIQAKGIEYSASALLGGDDAWSAAFENGGFATLYLAPKDYHRVHMPCDGVLRETRYVPGRLFSVAPLTTDHIPGLFARNERLVSLFETPYGQVAQILVGAMLVSAMETVWSGRVQPAWKMRTETFNGDVRLTKGEEMGRFGMGSTVILVTEPGAARWSPILEPGNRIQMGESIATGVIRS